MERAKQVTMGELNASIGVRGLPPLPPTVCTSIFSSPFFRFLCFFVFFPLLFCYSIVSELESWRFSIVRVGLIEGPIEAGGLGQVDHCGHFIMAPVRIVTNKLWDIGLTRVL